MFHDHYPARGRKLVFTALTAMSLAVSRPLPRKGTETRLVVSRVETGDEVSRPLPRKGTETRIIGFGEQKLYLVSRPLPRKGTETSPLARQQFRCFVFHDHYPARGRKHHRVHAWRCGSSSSFTTITPQGDGNGFNILIHFVYWISKVSRPLPRKGTETSGGLSHVVVYSRFHDHYPARGRKQGGKSKSTSQSKVSRPLPRKGTETFSHR